jgi:hypothetical protein
MMGDNPRELLCRAWGRYRRIHRCYRRAIDRRDELDPARSAEQFRLLDRETERLCGEWLEARTMVRRAIILIRRRDHRLVRGL